MAQLPWNKIETVLLDMDGTLLDLHYDSFFWLEHLPAHLAKRDNKPLEEVRTDMHKTLKEMQGSLEWYCLDYWADRLQLDIMAVKREIDHLIAFRPDTLPFLDALKESGRKVVLVTNAHPDGLSLKIEKTQLDDHIDTLISTHQFGVTKESQVLWQRLHAHLGFEKHHTLFVDDSQTILDAAKAFGIEYTLGISNPDSKAKHNKIKGHPSITEYTSLLPSIKQDRYRAIQ